MYLGSKVVRGKGIDTLLRDEVIPKLENPREVLKSGDLDTVVRSLLPFAIKKVTQYAAVTNDDPDELLGEALLGLMEGLKEMQDSNNFFQHLAILMERRITCRINKAYRRGEVVQSSFTLESKDKSFEALEIRDLIDHYIETPEEAQLIEYLLEGYTQTEIAGLMGSNTSSVSRLKLTLFERIRNDVSGIAIS